MVYDCTQRCIPYDTIHANKEHIRYLDHSTECGRSIPLVTRLKGLNLILSNASLHEELALLEANPGLLSLVLRPSFDSPAYSPSLIKPLTALQHLSLECGYTDFVPAFLKNILDNNQRLESLVLNVNYTLDPDFDDWSVYPSIKRISFQYEPF
ncbi:hypothetical protein BGZ94_006177, partial [Podila epigama]